MSSIKKIKFGVIYNYVLQNFTFNYTTSTTGSNCIAADFCQKQADT